MKMTSRSQPNYTPNKGEALVARLATSLASSLHLKKFIPEGDSQAVILALQQPTIIQDWHIIDIIQDSLDSILTPLSLLSLLLVATIHRGLLI
jgi:hypothetical protein